MRIDLSAEHAGELDILSASLAVDGTVSLRYKTRTGALLRVNGEVAGAFDREHDHLVVCPRAPATLHLEVEEQGLPTNALPSGPGLRWWWINLRARERAALHLEATPDSESASAIVHDGYPLIGHAHLDVAWLWTYEQAARKAMRTFAIAANLMERFPEFTFAQSQPQLYEFVERTDEDFFARVVELAQQGRFDASVAAMWVESDCNLPSGESLLRQMFYARAYCVKHFGVTPSVAWLPDSFGFANTIPTLLAHAGIPYFVTTKLQWNDTTRFPHPQFRWRGPDGSEIVSALMDSYEGDVNEVRIQAAKARNEALIAGYGDGGGGVTEQMIAQARRLGRWVPPAQWLEGVAAQRPELPLHADELYLEYHRGVYTTHHDIKARNAALERKLELAEEAAAWCVAVKAPKEHLVRLRAQLDDTWKIVLRNQFHDVLPGTSIHAVYEDVHHEYDAADLLVEAVQKGASAVLPRGRTLREPEPCVPVEHPDGTIAFDNGLVRALLTSAGVIVELQAAGARNVVAQANLLALYQDRPSKWEAWNIDADYDRRMMRPKHGKHSIRDGALHVPFAFGKSTFDMEVRLFEGEPFLRVDLRVDWKTRRTLLRVENWLAIDSDETIFGTPHGTIRRSAHADTPQERAKFEVPGQRFAAARDSAAGLALFALDTYGWSARSLPNGGMHLGHSLLRGTMWPDPLADLGKHYFSYAFAPNAAATVGALEQNWVDFAHQKRVRLFLAEENRIAVVACKPAHDGNGVIVRIRECNGRAGSARIRCGARMKSVEAVDAHERPDGGVAAIEGETIVTSIGAFALRSFRVLF